MRFVLTIFFALGVSSAAAAQTAASSPAFERQLFAGQLGQVSVLALGPDGSIYAADINRGRVYKLSDRAKDGRLDSKRIIAKGLQSPSGIAVIGERVFVSDARAIWEVGPLGSSLRRVASLENSRSAISPRPLILGPGPTNLIVGLTSPDRLTGKLVSVNIDSGAASLVSSGDGSIDAAATAPEGGMWIGSGSYILPVTGVTYSAQSGTKLGSNVRLSGLMLPSKPLSVTPLAARFPDHIFTVISDQGRKESFGRQVSTQVYAVPSKFGLPQGESKVQVMDAMVSNRTQSAKQAYGGAVMDERGLFIAGPGANSVWRIVKRKPKPEKEEAEEPEVIKLYYNNSRVPKAELDPRGSGITSASTLTKGTTIEVGSTIPEDEDDDKSPPDDQKSSKPVRSAPSPKDEG